MDKNNDTRERRVLLKARAQNILSCRGNLLRLIGAVLIVLTLAEAFIYFCSTVCHFFFDSVPLPILGTIIFFLFILISPPALAVFRMAYRMSFSEKTEMGDILYYFNRARLRGAYLISVLTVGELFFQFFLSFAFGRLIAYAFEGIYAEFFSQFALVLSLLIMPVMSGVFTNVLTLPCAYFMSDDTDMALSLAKGTQKGQVMEITVFNLSFLPLIALSVLSLGILFFVYVVPLYMISAQLLASYFIESKNSEKYRK